LIVRLRSATQTNTRAAASTRAPGFAGLCFTLVGSKKHRPVRKMQNGFEIA